MAQVSDLEHETSRTPVTPGETPGLNQARDSPGAWVVRGLE